MSKAAHRRWAVLCIALAFLACVLFLRIVLTNSYGYMGSSWKGRGTADNGGLSAAFQIQGDATAPVSPGISVPLDLRFTNPHVEAMTVTHLKVTIRKLTAPGADRDHPCSVNDYRAETDRRLRRDHVATQRHHRLSGSAYSGEALAPGRDDLRRVEPGRLSRGHA